MPEPSLRSELLVLEHEVLRAIATGQSLRDAMDLLCRQVEILLPDVACSVLAVEDGELHPLAGPSLATSYHQAIEGYPIGPASGSCGTAAFRREEVDVEDIATDPLWADVRQLILSLGFTGCWSSPILTSDGEVIGTFAFYYRGCNGGRDRERIVVSTCVPLCAIAIEHDRAHARAHRLAYRDALTQLANRTAFFDHASALMAADATRPLAVLYIDLDGFKEVNDSLGHWAGDRILASLGQRFAVAAGDGMIARLGGDEFAVMCADCDEAEATALARRLLGVFDAPFVIEAQQVSVTASIGIVLGRAGHEDAADLMKFADMALYRAKAEGGARFCIFDPPMAAAVVRRRELEGDLHRALARGELFLVYQPIVDLVRGTITGCEALVRWLQPGGGLRMPAEFIGLAEELGLIAPIGAWVIEEACREAGAWEGDAYVAVNLSAVQLRDPRFCDDIARILAQTGLPAARLQIEVKEAVLLSENPVISRVLSALRAMGVSVALDDFGAGVSSLRSVRTFRPDKIKVDPTFVREIDSGGRAQGIAGAVVALAQSLGVATIAEGIETAEQARQLLVDGCLEGQGYHFFRPHGAEEVRALFGRRGGVGPIVEVVAL